MLQVQGGGGEGVFPALRVPANAADAVSCEQLMSLHALSDFYCISVIRENQRPCGWLAEFRGLVCKIRGGSIWLPLICFESNFRPPLHAKPADYVKPACKHQCILYANALEEQLDFI